MCITIHAVLWPVDDHSEVQEDMMANQCHQSSIYPTQFILSLTTRRHPDGERSSISLNGESLNLVLESIDGLGQIATLVGVDGSGDNGAADTAGATKGHLGRNVDVGDVLVFGEERKMENDGEGVGIGGYGMC
jgi:hypothetical protein